MNSDMQLMLLESELHLVIYYLSLMLINPRWHLGFCNEDFLPTRRGFDSYYGIYLGEGDYYVHDRIPAGMPMKLFSK